MAEAEGLVTVGVVVAVVVAVVVLVVVVVVVVLVAVVLAPAVASTPTCKVYKSAYIRLKYTGMQNLQVYVLLIKVRNKLDTF